MGSVVAAIFAWSQAARTARLSSQTELQIAAAKEDAERRKRAFEAARAEAAPVEEALEDAWRSMQKLKDSLAGLAAADDDKLRGSTDAVIAAANSLSDGYVEHGARLTDETRRVWHKAKSLAVSLAGWLADATEHDTLRKTVTLKSDRLVDARNLLTDAQAHLATDRAIFRDRLAKKLLELI